MGLLESWVEVGARASLLARYPEVRLAADVTAAVLAAYEAGVLDATGLHRAAQIARALRLLLGLLQERDRTLPLDARCALALAVRGVRDAMLVLPWPTNPTGQGAAIVLTQAALDALDRALAYDPLLGAASYPGSALADIGALAEGFTVRV